MTQTDKLTVVTQAIIDILDAAKRELGLRQVYDGDMQLIPETPVVAVISGRKIRTPYGTGLTMKVDLQVVLMIYHNKIQEIQQQQREAITLSERIEDVLHRRENQTLNDLVIFGMVTSSEPGYADRQGTVLRTTRLVWEAQARTSLPMS